MARSPRTPRSFTGWGDTIIWFHEIDFLKVVPVDPAGRRPRAPLRPKEEGGIGTLLDPPASSPCGRRRDQRGRRTGPADRRPARGVLPPGVSPRNAVDL